MEYVKLLIAVSVVVVLTAADQSFHVESSKSEDSLYNEHSGVPIWQKLYPWSPLKTAEDRQEDILESLRKRMVLHMKEDLLPNSLRPSFGALDLSAALSRPAPSPPTGMVAKNLENYMFLIRREDLEAENAPATKSSSASSTSKSTKASQASSSSSTVSSSKSQTNGKRNSRTPKDAFGQSVRTKVDHTHNPSAAAVPGGSSGGGGGGGGRGSGASSGTHNNSPASTDTAYTARLESERASRLKQQQDYEERLRLLTDGEQLPTSFDDFCAASSQDYWNIEWCHRQDVRQVHWEVAEGAVVRMPDWSLGQYDSSLIVRERGESYNTSARIIKVFIPTPS